MKKVLCLILVSVLCMSCVLATARQGDCIYSSWVEEYVTKAYYNNWTDGLPNDFTNAITREQFCIVAERVLRALGENSEFDYEAPPFDDTGDGSVLYLYGLGIVKGKSKNEFWPDDLITREEAAVILSRMCDVLSESGKMQLPDIMIDMAYSDDEEISDWAKSAVYLMATHNVMQGTEKGFEPKGRFTVEQSLATFVRIYNIVNSKKEPVYFEDKLDAEMPEDENYMFSPLSIKMAFALVANGADENTKNEIVSVLNIKDLDDFNKYSKEIIETYGASEDIKLNVANSVWVNKSITSADFDTDFKNIATEYYSADTGTVTKKDATEIINGWVKEKTNDKIDSIITEDNTDFSAAIINAIYFNAGWQNEFYKGNTKPDVFTRADGEEKEIDFMNQTGYFMYCKTDNSRIIELPYRSQAFKLPGKNEYTRLDVSMYILLSDSEIYACEELNKAYGNYTREYVKLSMPKFELEYSNALDDTLKLIGMEHIFGLGFPNILEGEELFVEAAIHKTYIKVDEEGTEAAAVTAVMNGATAIRETPEPIEFKADKPFSFVIRDNTSGEILFMGRYAYAK